MTELAPVSCPACAAAQEANAALSRMVDQLQKELVQARADLADRKVIDRAKGILMERGPLSEDVAYSLMRRAAMNRAQRIVDVARWVLTAPADFLDSYAGAVARLQAQKTPVGPRIDEEGTA